MNVIRTVELLTVGTEILMGQIVNTNAAYLAKEVAFLGITSQYQTVVGDNAERLKTAIRVGLSRADCVVMTGGLGPTQDDISMACAAEVAGVPLVWDEECEKTLTAFFTSIGRTPAHNNYKQVMMPQGAQVMPNNNGTAPGAIITTNHEGRYRYIVLLPGPPAENQLMFAESVKPFLEKHSAARLNTTFVRMIGIGESDAELRLSDLIESQVNPTLAPYASEGEVMFRITQKMEKETDPDLREELLEEVKNRLGQYIYEIGTRPLPEVVKDTLLERGLTVAFAESCTAGLVAATFADLPGVSQTMLGGVVAYSNELKQNLLEVSSIVLDEHGAVSLETAEEMARGCLKLTGADLAVSVTGIAGPDGATEDKPVGLVYISVADRHGVFSRKFYFRGNRAKIRRIATLNAFNMMRLRLGETAGQTSDTYA